MKVLFVSYDLPYPLVSGGKIRAYYLLKALAQKYQVTLFSFYRQEEQKKYLAELKKYCRSIALFKRRRPWSTENLFFALTHFWLPFTAATYYSPELKNALLKELRSGHYDLVHFESFYPAVFLPLVKKLGVKTLMANENIEARVYLRYAQKKPFPFNWLLHLEVLKMKLYEEKLWRQADYNLAPSAGDAQQIEKVTGKACPVIANGVKVDDYQPIEHRKGQKTLIFIGTLVYPANADAIAWFLKKIYPQIKKQVKGVKFVLVSWFKPDWLLPYLNDPSIEFVDDKTRPASQLLGKGQILVAPIRIASGTNIKVLEALVAGLAVVATPYALEGLVLRPGQDLYLADQPADFAQKVVKLIQEPELRKRLSQSGKMKVIQLYDWQKIGKQLNRLYQKIDEQKD